MVAAQLRDLRNLLQRDFLVEVILDIGESASKCRCGGSTAMQLDEFVGEQRDPAPYDPGFSTCVLSWAVSQMFRSKKNSLGLNSISEKRNSGSSICG
jgi:hypothetical protein